MCPFYTLFRIFQETCILSFLIKIRILQPRFLRELLARDVYFYWEIYREIMQNMKNASYTTKQVNTPSNCRRRQYHEIDYPPELAYPRGYSISIPTYPSPRKIATHR